MSYRFTLLSYLTVLTAGAVVLAVSGTAAKQRVAFSAGVVPISPVATLPPHQLLCDRRIGVRAPFGAIRFWVSPGAAPGSEIDLTVSSSGHALATGGFASGSVLAIRSARLSRTVPASAPVDVCVRNRGPAPISFIGSAADGSTGHLYAGRHRLRSAMSLLMLAPGRRSLLSLLGTVFRRAALFRPGWMHAWFFWLLCAGLLGAAGAIGRALVSAAGTEQAEHQPPVRAQER